MIGKNISGNLRTFRKLLNLKQDDFAKPLGITGGYISAIEKGKSKLSEAVLCLMEVNYRLNRIWLETGEGDPFVKAWFNKLNLFKSEGGPILDNFKMELAVDYGPNDPRRSAGAKLYNIDPSNVSTPSVSYNQPPAADPWQEALDMARQVLESGTDHAGSLASTIKLSFNTIQDKKLLEEKCDTILKELADIKNHLSTSGREKEDENNARTAGG